MPKAIFIFILLTSCWCSHAQNAPQEVVVSSGGYFSSSSGSLAWALGEILTETYDQPSHFLTQGFHQPELRTAPGKELIEALYPNPTRDLVYIKMYRNEAYGLEILDVHGRELTQGDLVIRHETLLYEIDLRDLASALYLIKITNTRTGTFSFFKVEKI